jgi:hypothetical protein
MATQEQWRTTVQDLMLNFHEALVALTPYMDRVKIGWRDEEAYDDWDHIAQSLYQNMVLRSILFSTECQDDLATPDYGTVYPSYGDKSFIEIVGDPSQPRLYRVFVGFSTREHPFDQVLYLPVSGPDLRPASDPVPMRLGEAKFMFVINKGDGAQIRHSSILVDV